MTSNIIRRIAILAFGWIVCLSLGDRVSGSPQSPAPHGSSRANSPTESGLTFKTGNSGEVQTKGGIWLGFTDFTSSDGIGLRVFYLAESGPGRAAEAFKKELGDAVEVVEQGKKKNRSGQVVGERAVITCRAAKPFLTFSAIIWTDGETFHEIAGLLRHARELEKVYRY